MIGDRLKQLRENKGYNMRQMAAALNLPYTTYVNYEKGEREPNSEQLILFSKYFGVSIDYIIGITDNIKNYEPCNTDISISDILKQNTVQELLKEATKLRDTGQTELILTTSTPSISPLKIYYDRSDKGPRACEIFEKCYDTDIFEIVKALIKLDTFDRQLILNMIDGMLKAEKYTSSSQHLTTIYRAARSADNHSPEIVETTKDFSKVPTTKNKNL